MKAKDWLYIAGLTLLAVLLLRAEFCTKPKTVEVTRWQVPNMDSLKALIEPETIRVPVEKVVTKYVTLTITDQASADSLAQVYADLAKRYADLQTELQWAWLQGEGEGIEWEAQEQVYADSVTTPDYFHKWEIRAEGPINSYAYSVIPLCPAVYVPEVKNKMHRIGLLAGGQTMPDGLRPIFGATYGYGPIRLHGGYLPTAQGQKAQGQVLLGIEIPVR